MFVFHPRKSGCRDIIQNICSFCKIYMRIIYINSVCVIKLVDKSEFVEVKKFETEYSVDKKKNIFIIGLRV